MSAPSRLLLPLLLAAALPASAAEDARLRQIWPEHQVRVHQPQSVVDTVNANPEIPASDADAKAVVEELLGEGVYMTPTYGNTLMGLACSKPVTPEDGYKIAYYAPQPRAVIEVVSFDDPDQVVDYGKTGRVRLTTLTRETFIPGFLERDEGERERPYEQYPWDGVSGVRPFRKLAAATVVGVY